MMNRVVIKVLLMISLSGATMFGAIYSVEDRKKMVEDGRRVLGREVVFVEENLANRLAVAFGDETGLFVEVEEEIPDEVAPDQLIYKLAEQIHPTGVFSVNGDFYLILKERRIKAGSYMPVRYLGREYNVLLSDVVRNAFSIKVGEQEIQIKLK